MPLLERLGIAAPVVQAGMGGGLSRHELAAAGSEAGGLGTIAVRGARGARGARASPRAQRGGRPPSPYCGPLPAVIGWRPRLPPTSSSPSGAGRAGGPRRSGSISAVRWRRLAPRTRAGPARGPVRAQTPALALLEQVRAALPPDYPLLLAGGIADRGDVSQALEAGGGAPGAGARLPSPQGSGAPPAAQAT